MELTDDPEAEQPARPSQQRPSALKATSVSSDLESASGKRSLTVTFVDGSGEKGVEEMDSTPRRFFQNLLGTNNRDDPI